MLRSITKILENYTLIDFVVTLVHTSHSKNELEWNLQPAPMLHWCTLISCLSLIFSASDRTKIETESKAYALHS